MDTNALKSFAAAARTQLLQEVGARLDAVISANSPERREAAGAVINLEKAIKAEGRSTVVDRVAYTWFNRIVALRFMDANRYTPLGIVSPAAGQASGQPEVLAEAKSGNIDTKVLRAREAARVMDLLTGRASSSGPQQEAYRLLLTAYCNNLYSAMPFMFEPISDYTELLMPADLLSDNSIIAKTVATLTPRVCADVEVIGWLYQFYIADRKDEVFAGFKKNKKAGPAEIPAATQLFTPHWIVRYLVENSLGRLWLLNKPPSRLTERMDYYIAPIEPETDYLKISSPQEIKICDPACGSGHMLTYAYDLLTAIYEEEGYSPAEIPGLILTHNLYGIEIDPRAGALAAFALTMKARAGQRTFLAKGIQPNICVLRNVSFTPDEIDHLLTPGGDKHAETDYWQAFTHADLYGSLIQPNTSLTPRLRDHLDTLDHHDQLYTADTHERAGTVLTQTDYLASCYHVLITNPPYMGSANLHPGVADWISEYLPMGQADLFAAFISRCLSLRTPGGCIAMVTMQAWMFLPSFTNLREELLSRSALALLAQVGPRGFDTIGGDVVQTAAFATSTAEQVPLIRCIRLVDGADESEKAGILRDVAQGNLRNLYFDLPPSHFRSVPGHPLSYWLSPEVVSTFARFQNLGTFATLRKGLATGDNGRFLRLWHEVPLARTARACESREEAKASGQRWFPHAKGGPSRRWWGNVEHVIDWWNDGEAIRTFTDSSGKLRSRPQNLDMSFLPAVTWSKLGSKPFTARETDGGTLFDDAAAICYLPSADDRHLVLGLLNSQTAAKILDALNPTVNVQVGDIARLPIPRLRPEEESRVLQVVAEVVDLSRTEWNSRETSADFGELDFASRPTQPLSAEAIRAIEVRLGRQQRLAALRVENDRIWAEAFGDVLTTANPASAVEDTEASLALDLVSYGVGCMLGRFSLDVPGLVLANQGDSLAEYLARVPAPSFMPDADGVLPVLSGDWFADDIVGRFREFLRAAFGEEHFEENLRFVEESLGKDIRAYFVRDFYNDHVKRYKKRPIYWMFSSPKGTFNALIYLHRYRPDTVSVVLNNYLREFQAKLAARLTTVSAIEVSETAPAKERTAARKEADLLRKQLADLADYEHDVLYPLATRNIEIDLDDGVRANYPRFGAALKRIPGLDADE